MDRVLMNMVVSGWVGDESVRMLADAWNSLVLIFSALEQLINGFYHFFGTLSLFVVHIAVFLCLLYEVCIHSGVGKHPFLWVSLKSFLVSFI